jgi:erythrocyte band 7 integral membrane protein
MSHINSLDTKARAHSPSEGNVVDHHAANGMPLFSIHVLTFVHKLLLQVTDELPAGPKRLADPKSTMIQVQPLKRSEMQVNFGCRLVGSYMYLLNPVL